MFRYAIKNLMYQLIINVLTNLLGINSTWLIIVSYNIKINGKCILGVKFSYVKFIFQV